MVYKPNTLTRGSVTSFPRYPARRLSRSRSFWNATLTSVQLIFATAAFALFAIAAVAVLWYVWNALQNIPYKVVTEFVGTITIANVSSRYVTWAMKK